MVLWQRQLPVKPGVHRSTVGRWLQRPEAKDCRRLLATRSSRPHTYPSQLASEVVTRILELREQLDAISPPPSKPRTTDNKSRVLRLQARARLSHFSGNCPTIPTPHP